MMEIAITAIAAFLVGAAAGFVGGFRFADYLNERQERTAYFREREKDQGGGR